MIPPGENERSPEAKAGPSRRAGVWLLAILFILPGILLNQWLIEESLIPDEDFGPTIRAAIAANQAGFFLAGIFVFFRGIDPRRSWFSGSVAVFLFCLSILAMFQTVRLLRAPPWMGAGMSMVERLDSIARDATLYNDLVKLEAYSVLLKVPGLGGSLNLRMKDATARLLKGDGEGAISQLKSIQRQLEAQGGAPPALAASLRDFMAATYLRMGEQENCLARRNADFCYLPLGERGVYTATRSTRLAIDLLSAALRDNPDDLNSRFLLNIAYMTLGEYPGKIPQQWLIPPSTFASEHEAKPFRDIADDLGLAAFGLLGGSIMEDFDGDGYLDIMVSSMDLKSQLRYFRNNGDGTFSDRTREAGLLGQLGGFNLVHADYNNDGNADVLVLRGAWQWGRSQRSSFPFSLLRNDGNGRFTDVTEAAGLLGFHRTQTAAWADYDNDGWVDLFVGVESYPGLADSSRLFRNNGNGTFTELASEVGIVSRGIVKAVAWGDFNNDGRPDLMMSRFGDTNVLYRNDGAQGGRWRFTDVSRQAGILEPKFSFGTWFWDYDNDGWLDLFVAGWGGGHEGLALTRETIGRDLNDRTVLNDVAALYLGATPRKAALPRLYRNNGDGTFSDMTKSARLDRVLHVMGANFGDIDNDGFLDMYLGTGAPSVRALMPNRMFRSAAGVHFQDVTTSAGVGHLQKGHAVSFGDIDNDGDQDIYSVMGGWYPDDRFYNVLYENPGYGNHWITLRLAGVESNRAAIGARIKISVATEQGTRAIHATVGADGSFGGSSLQQEIGLGRAKGIRSIEITWPKTGKIQRFANVPMDRIYAIRETSEHAMPVETRAIRFGKRSSGR